MVKELDVWRAANVLIQDYGPDAARMVAEQAGALLAVGDIEGARRFKAIARTVVELPRAMPCPARNLVLGSSGKTHT